MNCISHKVAVITATLVSGLAVLNSNLAHAAIITSEFDVNVTSGPLAGNTYSGLVSYDDTSDSIGPFSPLYFPASDIEFTFNGITYTEDNTPSNPVVIVDRRGSIVWLSWSVTDTVSDTSFGFSTNSTFDFSSGFVSSFGYSFPITGFLSGVGDVQFSSLTPPKPLPELTKYTFTGSGFSGGGTLSGMFEGVNLDNNEFLLGDNLRNGVQIAEISNFFAEFTGDSITPDVTFKQEEMFFQMSWTFLPDGRLFLDFSDAGTSEEFMITSGSQLFVGTFGSNQESSVSTAGIIAKPVIVSESVPEPSSVFGLSILSLGFLLKKQKA
jgi:hypothetical protein